METVIWFVIGIIGYLLLRNTKVMKTLEDGEAKTHHHLLFLWAVITILPPIDINLALAAIMQNLTQIPVSTWLIVQHLLAILVLIWIAPKMCKKILKEIGI